MVREALLPAVYGHVIPSALVGAHAMPLSLLSPLGDAVDCRRYTGQTAEARNRFIVGFHGNRCNADSLDSCWNWMSRFGTVLAVNIPGYGNTPSPVDKQRIELHMAANVQTAASYAKRQGHSSSQITWFGMSLGGSQAAIGFQMMPGSHLLLLNTFTSVGEVAANVARPNLGRLTGPLVRQATMAAFPEGWRADGVHYRTDRLNTVKKLKACSHTHRAAGSDLLIVAAEKDQIMAVDFAPRLHAAYHRAPYSLVPTPFCIVPNVDHSGSFFNDAKALAAVQHFLRRQESPQSRTNS